MAVDNGKRAATSAAAEATENPHGTIMATGISAGAVWFCLRDLSEKAAQLPAGELRKTWTDAVAQMMKTFDDAQEAARLGR